MSLTKKFCFLLIYLLIPLPFIGYWLGGYYNFLIFYILFLCVPVIDAWVRDSSNPDPIQEAQLLNDPVFKMILLMYIPVQIILLLLALHLVSTQPLQWFEWLGFAMSVGLITGGVGITLAHELMHKNDKLDQMLSKALLLMVCYGHFMIEHVRGHHLRVATPEDPATARLGESFYQFLPRTLIGSFKSAWNLEKSRLKNKNQAIISIHNQFVWILSIPMILLIACVGFWGWQAGLFFLFQSFFAVTMLELVNYIEHYGLQRRLLPNGQYEKVSIHHSWNANHWLSNMLLFHLQRHSDHHTCGARPYQILRHQEEAPQLPSGYLGMMFVALIPPLWRHLMDKRALGYQKQIHSAGTASA